MPETTASSFAPDAAAVPPAAARAVPAVPVDGPPSWWQQRHPSPGFAPLEGDATCEVCVVGAGISGTSTAWHLARAGARVTLLDSREVAGGASGRNGGFLLAGLALRHEALVGRVGAARAAELHRFTADARDRLLDTARSLGLGEFARRTGSLRLAVDASEVEDLDREHALLAAAGIDARRLAPSELPATLSAHFLGGLAFDQDGASVPAAWVRGLATAAREAGVQVHEHTAVRAIERVGADHLAVRTDRGTVTAGRVVVCTEAYLGALLPELSRSITPYRSQVLAARLPGVDAGVRSIPCPMWSRRGWDYVQQVDDGTIVIGGELEEDATRLATWDEQPEPVDQAHIEGWLARVVGVAPEVVTRWAGVLAMNHDGFPYVGAVPGRSGVYVCGGWGGAGNVLGFAGGQLVAELLAGGGADVVPAEFDPARGPG